MPDVLLIAANISKRFGPTQALDAVTVSFRAGEVHALMGENGAGKSTLARVIAGLHAPDAGTVTIAGRPLRPGSIDDAFDAGVRIVHQELAQCPNLTVAENLSLHALPGWRGLIDRRRMIERAAQLVHRLDPQIDVTAPLGSLPPGRRQIVQIASSLDERADGPSPRAAASVLLLDEPTSSLTHAESARLLEIVRELKAAGLTVIYVSHRMAEVFAACDRATVLRDGRWVATTAMSELDEHALVEQMIGRQIGPRAPRRDVPPAARDTSVRPESARPLAVARLSSAGRFRDISLTVGRGEIVGLAGLVGCGRSELLDAIFGLDPRARGAVRVLGRSIGRSARAAIRAGMGYVPEDRRRQGLFLQAGADLNMLMPVLGRIAAPLGARRPARERRLVEERLREFRVKASSRASLPLELSGGNQQKLLLARWLDPAVKVLLLDEPTRGIDVGTKWEIHRQIRAAADAGAAILLVSSELPELLSLADRVLVMSAGRVRGELVAEGMTQAAVMRLATATPA